MRNVIRHLEKIAVKDLDERRRAVKEILLAENIKFSLINESPSIEFPNGILNFMFKSGKDNKENPRYLFSAHYDNFPGSFGANDNASSICILIDLFLELNRKNISADFILLDGEESGHSGSKIFVDYIKKENLKIFDGIINLDVCGYGDYIVISGKGYEKKSIFHRFSNREIKKKYNVEFVNYLPESDDVIFRKNNFPTLNISIVPKWDVQYLRALGSYGERIFGMPPEFEMILSEMEVTQTMHGGFRDKIEYVKEESVQKVLDFLIEVMLLQEEKKSWWIMKIFSH